MKQNKGSELRKELLHTLSECESKLETYRQIRIFINKYQNDGIAQMMILMLENKFVHYCSQQKILELRKKSQLSRLATLSFKDKEPVSRHKKVLIEGVEGNEIESHDYWEEKERSGNVMDKELDFLLDIMKEIEELDDKKNRILDVYRTL